MGRMVSCKNCGVWAEAPAQTSPTDWLCDKCQGGPPGVEPRSQAGAAVVEAARGIAIGHDSGPIGSSSFGLGSVSLDEQLQQMREAVSSIKVGTADLEEAGRRLSAAAQSGLGAAEVGAGAVAGVAAGLVGRAAQAARAGAYELADEAKEFARAQADTTLKHAQELLQEKGVKAVPEARQFVKGEAHRIAQEARGAAEQKVLEASDRATAAAREALDQARAGLQRGILRPETPPSAGICGLCSERIVAGDRVTLCPNCGTRYHANCYNLVGHCPSQQCRERQAAQPAQAGAQPASATKPVFPAMPVEALRRCASCGARIGDKALICPQCGRWVTKGRQAGMSGPGGQTTKFPVGCIVAIVLAVFFFLLFALKAGHH